MPSSRQPPALALAIAAFVAVGAFPKGAQADATTPQGFAVERFYPSAPGGGWFVMDALDMHGNLGGAMAFTSGYALKPLRVTDGSRTLPVVEDEAVADFGFAATYDRFRLYLDLQMPFLIAGQGGPVGNYWFVHPAVDLGSNPDTLADARIGFDARLYGSPTGAFRLGAGAQLLLPSGRRSDYDTDGTYRAMLRVLAAGDVGWFTYAGQVGVHVRPLDDAPIPGSPQGSELLFGVAAGAKLAVWRNTALVVGPEVFGETAFRSFFGTVTTGVEGLVSGRLEGTGDDGIQLRARLGTGAGLDEHFGAPEWRLVFGVEAFARTAGPKP